MQSISFIPASNGAANVSLMTVQTLRAPGAVTITTNTVAGAPTKFYATMGTPHTFTDPVTSEVITIISEASAVDFAGTINAGKVDIVAIAPGYTDAGSKVGDIIVIRPITEWANNLFNVLSAEHLDTGKHGAVTADSVLINGNLKSLGNDGFYANAIINGSCEVAQRVTAPTLSTVFQYGAVDRFAVKATGTAVSAGTISQSTTPAVAAQGASLKVAGVTVTGTGIVFVRYRIEAKDALKFVNQAASFGVKVRQDTGGSLNYTVYIRKPTTTADDFSATTAIVNSAALPVLNNTDTTIVFENINTGNLGDVSKGIEIEIQIACGAVTTKNFEFYGFQFNLGAKAANFQPKPFADELLACLRYYEKTNNYEIDPMAAAGLVNGAGYTPVNGYLPAGVSAGSGNRCWKPEPFKVIKRIAPTLRYHDGAGNISKNSIGDVNMGAVYTNQAETFRGIGSTKNGMYFQAAPTGNNWIIFGFDADAEL